MKSYRVTANLRFDVTVPVTAEHPEAASEKAEQMDLSEFLDWAGLVSYDLIIENVEEAT
jgi:hypothetical protein